MALAQLLPNLYQIAIDAKVAVNGESFESFGGFVGAAFPDLDFLGVSHGVDLPFRKRARFFSSMGER
jgi:hypothetical protein